MGGFRRRFRLEEVYLASGKKTDTQTSVKDRTKVSGLTNGTSTGKLSRDLTFLAVMGNAFDENGYDSQEHHLPDPTSIRTGILAKGAPSLFPELDELEIAIASHFIYSREVDQVPECLKEFRRGEARAEEDKIRNLMGALADPKFGGIETVLQTRDGPIPIRDYVAAINNRFGYLQQPNLPLKD